MTVDEKIAVLARAVQALAEKSARTWDFDGEQQVAEGVSLPFDVESALDEIIEESRAALQQEQQP